MTYQGHFPGFARFVRFWKRGHFIRIPGVPLRGNREAACARVRESRSRVWEGKLFRRLMRTDSVLTRREKEVLKHIGHSKTSKQIAGILNLSVYTIGNHRR